MQSLTLYADETIDTANRLVAAAAAGHCTLCDADGTPIGVTSSVPGPSGLVSGFALANDVFTWVVAANGTSTVNVETNIATGGYGWLQLASIANAGGDTLTNITLKYSVKKLQ